MSTSGSRFRLDPGNPHSYVKFGDPFAPPGARFIIQDPRALVEVRMDLRTSLLRARGILITTEVRARLERERDREWSRIERDLCNLVIPDRLIALLGAVTKAEAKKSARHLRLTQFDLVALIWNCRAIGFVHSAKHKRFVPGTAVATGAERAAIFERSAPNAAALAKTYMWKVKIAFAQRRCLSAHLFECGDSWHCFWFTYRDVGVGWADPHWEGGPHLHYRSHLWAGFSKERVWAELENRRTAANGVHVRFDHDGSREYDSCIFGEVVLGNVEPC